MGRIFNFNFRNERIAICPKIMTRPAYLKIDQKYILRLSFWCSVRSRKEIVSNPFRATLHGTRTLYATASNTEGGTGTGSDPIPLYPRNWFVIDDVEYRGRKCLEETIEDSLCVYNGKGISKREGFSRLKGYVTARDGSIRTLRSRYFR